MIKHLHIKNIALIEESNIYFHKGLNILSGETGAGKSMLILSISFLLGARITKDIVRKGTDTALVEGMIELNNELVVKTLKEMAIEVDSDNLLLITRSINKEGKSACKINGKNVTIGMLKEMSTYLIDFHGQHSHQWLLNSNKHIELLDKFCSDKIENYKDALSVTIKKYKEISKTITSLTENESNISALMDIKEFQLNEINSADLKINEEENLQARKNKLKDSEKLTILTEKTLSLLSSENEPQNTVNKIENAVSLVKELFQLDNSNEKLSNTIEEISVELSEVVRELRSYEEELEHDPYELDEIESRLDLIQSLKKKYGKNILEILEYKDKLIKELDQIENREQKLISLKKQKKECVANILKHCNTISTLRKDTSILIKKEIIKILNQLGMKDAQFDILIEQKKEFSTNGFDKVEFLISANKGEALKPLAKIASGGEMSRVMLALKTVLADVDNIETFIFDEIDTGVSGRAAQQVAEKLALISKNHQLICITHLPQIASMAQRHFLINKKTDGEKTTTEVIELDYEKSVSELARLIGGIKITDQTILAAKELKNQCKEFLDKGDKTK